MKLQTFRHLWGLDTPLPQAIPQIAAAGYSGIEVSAPALPEPAAFEDLCAPHGLQYIAQIFSGGSTVAEHLSSIETQVKAAAAYRPLLINCHSGKDAFSWAQSVEFFTGALKIERSYGIPISHETHRGRILYNPWTTRDLLKEFPDLKLTCDFSHWTCVAERLLEDCDDIMQLAAQHCLHVHARVGQPHAPQVSDPRAPEWAEAVAAHERWWDMVWASQRQRGLKVSTLTPEFGPPGYMPTLPYTQQPVADLQEICNWMAQRQLQRFTA